MIPSEYAHWVEFFGRLHIMVLHLPIGLIVGLGVLEFIAVLRSKPASREVVGWVVWLAALSAGLAAGSGYVYGLDPGDPDDWRLIAHRQLGIAVAGAAVLTALVYSIVRVEVLYRILLLITIGLLIPVGHLGASMTHGPDFLTRPFSARPGTSPVATPLAPASTTQPLSSTLTPETVADPAPIKPEELFATQVQPVLAERCIACHGQQHQKGGLALHSMEELAKGGKNGPVITLGKPAESMLVQRLRLPLTDDKHMPPASKPQLTETQIQAIERWIAAEAPLNVSSEAQIQHTSRSIPEKKHDEDRDARAGKLGPPPAKALAALKTALVHYEAAAAGSNLLKVDFAAIAPRLSDAEARPLIEPLLPWLDTLSLSRATTVSDDTIRLLKDAPHLRELNLGGTKVGDAGLAALAGLQNLKELVLARTRLSDGAVEAIAAIRPLEQVYLWKSGLSEEAIARLRTARPELRVDAGDSPLATTQESEPEIKLTSDAPVPGQPPPAAGLAPVNNLCPVTDAPVNPQFAVVYKNRVVGFCCPNCPGQFWADPAKFEAKLPAATPDTPAAK